MRCPWIARVAYEHLREDNARLLTLVERLTEREYRIARKEVGLPEREPEERPAPVVWDGELEAAAQAWGSSAELQRQRGMERLRAGWTRESVLAAMLPDDGGEG